MARRPGGASGASRAVTLAIAILAVARPHPVLGVKVHADAASLNQTASRGDDTVEANEVPLSGESDEEVERDEGVYRHPHEVHGKPSKFDADASETTHTDDESLYQIEASSAENSTPASLAEFRECRGGVTVSCIGRDLSAILDKLSEVDTYNVTDAVQIVRAERTDGAVEGRVGGAEGGEVHDSNIVDKVHRYAKEHVVKIRLDKDLIGTRNARTFFGAIFQGNSTFLTGFGLGFLAFGLKKLLLPLFFGVQIIKSILLALFLPSIIGSIGNIVGKATAPPEENFEFKDNSDLYNDDYLTKQPVGTLPASAMYDESMMQVQKSPEIASRYSFADPRITHANSLSDRYYTRHIATHGASKKQDFKVFHEIPTSSLLLTNYDPFYSPLLSRLDAVFSRLGHTTEGCREYAVCAMYRSPARYAPYSNLVSAQLSRELNELRKPSSDNPDVLRFFRYMKAAKDGQDGLRCEEAYANCETAREDPSMKQNQAMLATYQDIDKLVQARKL